MNWDQLKNRLAEEVPAHQSAVNIDEIWRAIEPEVDVINAAKRKRRGGMYFWLLAGVLLLSTGTFWVLNNNQFNNLNQQVVITSPDNQETEKPSDTAESNQLAVDENKNDAALKINDKDANTKTSETKETGLNQLVEKSTIKNNSIVAKDNKSKRSNPASAKTAITTSLTPTVNTSSSNLIKENKNSVSEESTTVFSVKEPLINSTRNSNSDIGSAAAIASRSSVLADNSGYQPLVLNTLLMELDLPEFNVPKIKYLEIKATKIAAVYGKRRRKDWNYGIQLIGGASVTGKQMSAKDTLGSMLLPFRRNSEKTLETTQLGLLLDGQHRSGLGFSVGVQQTKISEKYFYQVSSTDTTFMDGVQSLSINLNGDTIKNLGPVPTITTRTSTKTVYNSYSMYDIPLLISYHQDFTDFYLGVQAGVFVNVALSAEGSIANGPGSDITIEDQKPELFKSSVGASFYLGGSIRKPIFENLELSFTPFVRYFPKDFSSAANPIQQKYILFGGNVGVGYRF